MVDKFTMPDGRIVTVNWTDTQSLLKIAKNDWAVIDEKLKAALAVVQAPDYCERLANSIGFNSNSIINDGNGCYTINR